MAFAWKSKSEKFIKLHAKCTKYNLWNCRAVDVWSWHIKSTKTFSMRWHINWLKFLELVNLYCGHTFTYTHRDAAIYPLSWQQSTFNKQTHTANTFYNVIPPIRSASKVATKTHTHKFIWIINASHAISTTR